MYLKKLFLWWILVAILTETKRIYQQTKYLNWLFYSERYTHKRFNKLLKQKVKIQDKKLI